MKKICLLFSLLFTLSTTTVSSQTVINRDGNTFRTSTNSTAKKDTLVTQFVFEDRTGTQYPIIVNKNTGSCYIWKKSSKTGKMYKQYMKAEISEAICKELNIEYKRKKR